MNHKTHTQKVYSRIFFITLMAFSSVFLNACGDDNAHLKPKSQNIGAEPGSDPVSKEKIKKEIKAAPKSEDSSTEATEAKPSLDSLAANTVNQGASTKNNDTDKEQKTDNADTPNGNNKNEDNTNKESGKELSAQADLDNTPEPKIEKSNNKNNKSVAIAPNKPTVSTMDSIKEIGENMAGLLKKKPVNFTQCFQSFAEGDYARKIEFYADNERKCWGQAWAIPKAYIYNIREEPNDDILILKFDVKTMKSDEDTKELINNTTLVVMTPSAGFSPKRTTMKRKISSVASVFENQRQMFGMDLYEPSRWQNEFRSVFFFNENNKDFYSRCLLSASEKIDEAPDDLKCDIYTHVDNRVDIDYKINFADMDKIEDINKNVQNFLRGMMRKSTKK